MAINKQLQNVRDDIYEAELGDSKQWTRAKVCECLVSAVIVAQRLAPDDVAVVEMLARWPDECSVRFKWFQNLARQPELQINPQQLPSVGSMDNVYLVVARWLDLVDSHMDRTVLVLHVCGISFDRIVAMFPGMRWTRQTLSRRHTKCLDALVYNLNHIDDLKWPVGRQMWG